MNNQSLSLALLFTAIVSTGHAGQIVLACDGRTVTRGELGVVENEKTWTDELLTFDLDKMIVFHGDETEGPTITRVTPTIIAWAEKDGAVGSFNRVGMNGREQLQALGRIIVNYYDKCRNAKPRI
jgi:hypothetical protein